MINFIKKILDTKKNVQGASNIINSTINQRIGNDYFYEDFRDYTDLEEKINDKKTILSTISESDPRYKEINIRLQELENEKQAFKNKVISLANLFNKIEINTHRLIEAKNAFVKGDLKAVDEILNVDKINKDYDTLKIEQIKISDEFLIKAIANNDHNYYFVSEEDYFKPATLFHKHSLGNNEFYIPLKKSTINSRKSNPINFEISLSEPNTEVVDEVYSQEDRKYYRLQFSQSDSEIDDRRYDVEEFTDEMHEEQQKAIIEQEAIFDKANRFITNQHKYFEDSIKCYSNFKNNFEYAQFLRGDTSEIVRENYLGYENELMWEEFQLARKCFENCIDFLKEPKTKEEIVLYAFFYSNYNDFIIGNEHIWQSYDDDEHDILLKQFQQEKQKVIENYEEVLIRLRNNRLLIKELKYRIAAKILRKLADVQCKQQNYLEAIKNIQKAINTYKKLCEDKFENYCLDLGNTYSTLTHFYKKNNDLPSVIDTYLEALDCFQGKLSTNSNIAIEYIAAVTRELAFIYTNPSCENRELAFNFATDFLKNYSSKWRNFGWVKDKNWPNYPYNLRLEDELLEIISDYKADLKE